MDHSTRKTLRIPASAAAAGLLLAITALTAHAQSPATAPAPGPATSAAAAPAGWTKATTVFVNTVLGSRTGGSAKRINESHAEMEAKGWRFMSLETYTENGDLVGFFVTYVK
jgi:hypothetical protein